MFWKTALAALALTTLALAPSGHAFAFEAAPETPVSSPWLPAAHPSPSPGSTDLGVERALVLLEGIGDVDGDGVDDVLQQVIDLDGGDVLYQAISGASLRGDILAGATAGGASGSAEVLWSVSPEAGSALSTVGDLDADGVLDPMVVTETVGMAEGTAQSAAGAHVQDVQSAGQVAFQALGGASADTQTFLDLALEVSSDTQGAGADLLEQAGAQAQSTTRQVGHLQATGQGALAQVEQTVEQRQASLVDQVQGLVGQSATHLEVDSTIQLLDLTGRVQGEIELVAENVNPAALEFADLDLDGVPDAVLLEVEKVSQIEEHPVLDPVVRAYNGADAEALWEVAMERLQGVPMVIPELGDVNADGKVDLGYLAIDTSAGLADPSSTFQILSGLDGEVLAEAASADGIMAAVPFGQVDASNGAELLRYELNADGSAQLALTGADLEPVWELDLPTDAVPLNAVENPFTGHLTGFSDWTGDAVADVVVATGGAVQGAAAGTELGVTVAVHSGVDGALVWEQTFEQAVGVAALADLSGTGAQDLAVLQATGQATQLANGLTEAEGLDLTLLQGEDGQGVWRLPVLADAGASANATLDAQSFYATVDAVGDVDGDGVQDLVLRIEHVLEGAADVDLKQVNGELVAATEAAVGHVYTISGRSGTSLSGQTDELASDMPAVPLRDLSDVQPLDAYQGGSEDDERGVPGFGLVAFVAALGAALAALRRRR